MIITISGPAVSGKSRVGKLLAEQLHYKYHSMGAVMRDEARAHNLELAQFQELCEKDPQYDQKLDQAQKKIGIEYSRRIEQGEERGLIMDGRLSWYFIPHSVKLYIDCSLEERAGRILKDPRPGEKFKTLEDAYEKLVRRSESDSRRFKEWYGQDCFDTKNYDMVFYNSNDKEPEQVVDEIIAYLKERE